MNAIPTATKVLGALTILLTACGSNSESVDLVPPRPENLPEQAEWRGDVDGGNWVFCERQGSIYACSTYWIGGEIYSRQSFRLCAEPIPTQLFGGHNLSGVVSIELVPETVRFVPISPAQIFSDGQVDEVLTAKVRSEFEAAEAKNCPVELIMNEDFVD